MKQVAVAFSTNGNSPKEGHRFSEIVLIGQENGRTKGDRFWFRLNDKPTSGQQVTFAGALPMMKTLVGDAQLIVHDIGRWRRFLRAELRTIKRHGADKLMNNVVDVSSWAHQRFPRQRKEVAGIARRAGIEIPADLTGLELEAELLRKIANVMTEVAKAYTVSDARAMICVVPTNEPSLKRCWVEQVGCFWRRLTGRI